MMHALKYSPLQVCNTYHAFEVCGYIEGKSWLTYDTYGDCAGGLPWEYKFEAALGHYLIRRQPKPMPELEEGKLYQLVEGLGGFYLQAAGKLRQDELSKLLASWVVRNNGKTEGKVGTLVQADLEGRSIYNLKGVLISQ